MLLWQRLFAKQGFAILPERLATPEVSKLLLDLAQIQTPRGKAGVRHLLDRPSVNSLARERRFLGVAQHVLGLEAFPFRATLFDKSPERNWLISWHQDTALPLCERREMEGWGPWSVKEGIVYAHAPAGALHQVLALRIHLDESSSENGPLRVLPGTHAFGVLSDEEIHRLSTEIAAVTCTVVRGGILAMMPLLVHSSSKSQTEVPRRVLHIEYASAPILTGGMPLAST